MTKKAPFEGNMTIDKLAIIMGKSFEHLEKRFDGVDVRLDKVESRLDGVEVRLDNVETRLDKVDTKLDRIENNLFRDNQQRIERLEDKMAQVQVALGKTF